MRYFIMILGIMPIFYLSFSPYLGTSSMLVRLYYLFGFWWIIFNRIFTMYYVGSLPCITCWINRLIWRVFPFMHPIYRWFVSKFIDKLRGSSLLVNWLKLEYYMVSLWFASYFTLFYWFSWVGLYSRISWQRLFFKKPS